MSHTSDHKSRECCVSLLSIALLHMQDDVVMGTLSVRENLQFSAALRLPGHMTRQQRNERVQGVIDTLNLQRCASTKVRWLQYKSQV